MDFESQRLCLGNESRSMGNRLFTKTVAGVSKRSQQNYSLKNEGITVAFTNTTT